MSATGFDRMMRVTSTGTWALLGVVGVVLGGVVIWSIVDTLPERIEGQGVLQTESGTQQITAAGQGILFELSVKPGDEVQIGQVIGTVRASGATEASRAAQARYDEALRAHTALEESENRIMDSLRSELRRKRSVVSDRQQVLATQRKNLEARIVTQATVDDAKRDLDIARNEVTDYEMRIRSREQAIATSQSGVEQARISLERTLGTVAEVSQVQSGVAGRVTLLHRRPGDMVYSGQPIADVQSTGGGGALEVVAYVAAKNGKRVLPGQSVRVAVAGVPVAEFGYLTGQVTAVSDYPVPPARAQRMLKDDGVTEPSYEVRIKPVSAPGAPDRYVWMGGPGKDDGVRAGTTVSASVQVADRRPITLVLPLRRDDRVPQSERTGTVTPGPGG